MSEIRDVLTDAGPCPAPKRLRGSVGGQAAQERGL